MKKKILVIFVSIIATLCCALGAVGCFGDGNSDSGSSGQEENKGHSHSLTLVGESKPTCTEDGNTAYYSCSGCGKWFSDKDGKNEITDKSSVTLAKGHKLTFVGEKAATCTVNGNTAYYSCSGCGKWFSDKDGKNEITDKSSVTLAKGHKLTFVDKKEATCAQAGNTAYYSCSGCGKYFSDKDGKTEITNKSSVVLTKEHELTRIPGKSPTCTEDGNVAYYVCNVCKHWFHDEGGKSEVTDMSSIIMAKGHKLTLVEGKEATCEHAGNTAYYTCSGCDKWFTDKGGKTEITDKSSVVLTKEHVLTFVEAKAVSCTQDGNTAYYACSGCGKWFSDKDGETEITDKSSVIFKKGHKLSGVAEKTATCTEDGNVAYYICSVCNKWFKGADGKTEITDKTSVIIARGHNLSFVPGNEATCTENGNIEYYACSVCDKWFTDAHEETEITDKQSVIIPKEHNYENNVCTECAAHEPTSGLAYIEHDEYCGVGGIGTVTDADIYILDEYKGKPVTYVGTQAFMNSSITSVVIPDGVTRIANEAFFGCLSLESVTIPKSVTVICGAAFTGNVSLTDIYFGGTRAQWKAIQKQDYWDSETGNYTVHCKDGDIKITYGLLYTEYDNHSEVGGIGSATDSEIYIADEYCNKPVTAIGSSAFLGCDSITSVVIPEIVTHIANEAFAGCTALKSVTVPISVSFIDGAAFGGCFSLTDINFGGTKEQWRAIEKSEYWDYGSEIYTVHCTDGDISCDGYDPADDLKYNEFDDYCEIGGIGTCTAAQIYILSEYNGKPVTAIGNNAFSGCTALTSVKIPDSIKSIGSSAFEYCSGLTGIKIPDSVTYVGDSAFKYCDNLTSAIIGDGVTSLGGSVFSQCGKLTDVTICKNVTSIGQDAFLACGLTRVNIPQGVNYIGTGAFEACAKLSDVYYGGTKAQWKAIPKGNTWDSGAGDYTVHCADGDIIRTAGLLYTEFDDHSEVSGIGTATDADIYIADEYKGKPVTAVKTQAFMYSNILSVIIPDGVTYIANEAFFECPALKSVTIPESVTFIDGAAFTRSVNLKDIYFGGTKAQWKAIQKGVYWDDGIPDYVVYCTDGDITSSGYEPTFGLLYKEFKDHSEVCGIGTATETDIRIATRYNGKPVTAIDYNAFAGCENLTSVTIPDGIISIGQEAFKYCYGLTEITIPDSVVVIGWMAFYYCTNLKSVSIGNGSGETTYIDDHAFSCCSNLTNVTIGGGSKTLIYRNAFFCCYNIKYNEYENALYLGNEDNPYFALIKAKDRFITSCTVSEKTKVICEYAFENCEDLASLVIPDGATYIGRGAFSGCSALTSVIIPDSVNDVSSAMFSGCSSLTSVKISDNITFIGGSMFKGCSALTSVTIGAGVTDIYMNTFNGCGNLKEIHFGGTKAQWDKIDKNSSWDNNTGNYTIYCTDGEISKS